MITLMNRFAAVVTLALMMLLMWVLLEVFAGIPKAHARDLNITWHPPTVSGIEASPSPAPFYQRGPVIRRAPSPGIMYLDNPAPPNGCLRPAFRVVSGPAAGRGCYGAQ